jgi:hypothetical protein
MKQNGKWLEWLAAGTLTVVSFLFFLFLYPYHNLLKEQMTLFLHTPDHFLTYLEKPAWLSSYAGDLLTQFYITAAGGAVVVSLAIIAVWLLFRKVFLAFNMRQATASILAVIPVTLEFLFHCGLHYPLSSTLSTLLALCFFLIYIRIRNRHLFLWLFLPVFVLVYYLAGHGAILFTLLWLVFGLIHIIKYRLLLFIPAVLGMLIPMLLRPVFLLNQQKAYTYPVKAPVTLNISFTWEKILALDYHTQKGNWYKVIYLAQQYGMQNRVASYYTNLALSQSDLLGDWLFLFYQPGPGALFLPVSQQSTPLTIAFSNEVFFRLGDMNMAQHSAMLGMIFSQNHRSSRLAKRLAEIHIAIGDAPAAEKYLGLLEKTLFHRKWAGEHRKLLQATDIPLREKIPSMDTIRLADDYVNALEILLQSNPDNKMALDYLLCTHILRKDIPAFRRTYDKWYVREAETVPGVYAQALIVSLYMEGASDQMLKAYGIQGSVINHFMEYTNAYGESKGDPAALQEVYGNTFWFYYHFAVLQQ